MATWGKGQLGKAHPRGHCVWEQGEGWVAPSYLGESQAVHRPNKEGAGKPGDSDPVFLSPQFPGGLKGAWVLPEDPG